MARATLLIAFFVVICTGEALKCYVCDSDNPKCAKPNDDLLHTETNGRPKFPFKTCVRVSAENDGDSGLVRDGSPFPIEIEEGCVTLTGPVNEWVQKMQNSSAVSSFLNKYLKKNAKVTMCTCAKDKCNDNRNLTNGAPTNTGNMVFFIAVPMFLQRLLQ